VCKATSEGVKKAWAEGKYHTEAVINNRKVNLSRVGASAEQMNELRAKVDMEKLKATNSEKLKSQMAEWKAEGKLDAIRRKAGNAKGMPDHLAAKQWRIRSPRGEVYHFSNLAAWARRNKHMFVDDHPHSKTPFWKRIAGGITDLLKSNGRSCSYRGWVAVAKSEHVNGAPDLLGRDVSVQNDPTLPTEGAATDS
jgi:formate-dependent nitrite reductase cytochrome c552 subunit